MYIYIYVYVYISISISIPISISISIYLSIYLSIYRVNHGLTRDVYQTAAAREEHCDGEADVASEAQRTTSAARAAGEQLRLGHGCAPHKVGESAFFGLI